MKLRIAALAIAGALVLCGAAFAQNVPEKFVVSGKMAEKIQDFTTINLATAEAHRGVLRESRNRARRADQHHRTR